MWLLGFEEGWDGGEVDVLLEWEIPMLGRPVVRLDWNRNK